MLFRVLGYFFAFMATSSLLQAEAPRYRWQPNSQFVYQVRITADTPFETETLSGHIVFDVLSASEPMKLKYSGGLTKTSKKKPGAANEGRSNPFSADPFGPGGADPFARRVNPFQGLEQTTNEIVLSPTGEVLALTGSSQLPYLLGNLSLLVFEPLPEADQPSWKVERGIIITEKADQRGPADFFDPFAGPRGSTQDKQSAGGRTTSFALEKDANGLVVYLRRYHMNSPGENKSLNVDGIGRWTFNRNLGVSESLDVTQALKIKLDNIDVSIPVTIQYERLSSEAWAKLSKDRLAREDALRAMSEQRTAEAKAAAQAPIAGSERARIMASLKQPKQPEILETLREITTRSPRQDDELARLVEPLVRHSDKTVQDLAKQGLAIVSPSYKRLHDLNRAYQRSYEVSELGLWVTYDAPLPAGLIVAVNSFHDEETKYFPATIVEPLSNGLVRVKYQDDRNPPTEERLREDMFLPPSEVEQPNLTPDQLAALRSYEAEVRQSIGNSRETEVLIRAYRDGNQPVPKTGNPVPPGMALPKFLVVAAKRNNQWYQAHISNELPDGKVALRFSGARSDDTLARSDIRLPPPEVKEPNVTPPYPVTSKPASTAATTAVTEFRTWSDNSGTFKIEAKIVEHLGESIRLVRKDGKQVVVPLSRLSEADRTFASTFTKPSNPFEP